MEISIIIKWNSQEIYDNFYNYNTSFNPLLEILNI